MRKHVALIIASIAFLVQSAPVHAQEVTVICSPYSGTSTHTQSIATLVEGAQTFTTSFGFDVDAIKLPILHITGQPDSSVFVDIYPTADDGSGKLRPDHSGGSVIGTSFSTTLLNNTTGTAADQDLTCDPLDLSNGYLVDFGATATLDPNTTYAIEVDGGCGAACAAVGVGIFAVDPLINHYTSGQFHFNGSVDDENIVTDWADYDGLGGGLGDSGFAVYSDGTGVPADSVEAWLDNFVFDWLGFSGDAAMIIFGIGLAGAFVIALLSKNVPPLIAMAFGGYAVGTFTLATILPPFLFLSMFAISGVAILLGFTVLRGSAEDG
jgi:hypothetical protein